MDEIESIIDELWEGYGEDAGLVGILI